MGDILKLDVKINENAIEEKLENLTDDKVMLAIHKVFAKMCEPYVPYKEGVLSETALENIYPEYVHYIQHYAHYMYMGEIYGPNYPINSKGQIDFSGTDTVEWRSSKGKGSKYPTGRPIKYNTEHNSYATKEWDKAMMRDKGDEFIAQVTEILRKKAKGEEIDVD